jgi:seryl-tRNA synthetase
MGSRYFFFLVSSSELHSFLSLGYDSSMLAIELLREKGEWVKKEIAKKNADPVLVDRFLELDGTWKALTGELDALRAEQKKFAEARDITGGKAHKALIKEKEESIAAFEGERMKLWRQIPNVPSSDTPVGKDEDANVVLRTVGELPAFSFPVSDHVVIGERLGVLDTARAGDVSGARFAYLKGGLVRLEFGLIQFVLEELAKDEVLRACADQVEPGYSAKPFIPVLPPVMIRPDVFERMARLEPKDERYYIPSDDVYLTGSAEHTLGPIHMDETLRSDDLPIRYLGFSTAFRREAGSYGKDTKGIIRLHQFDKLEMESFSTPEDGQHEQDFFVAVQEHLTSRLGIPYRIVLCSTGDQGDPDARHLDLEMWMPGQGKYRETHSADYMTDYQARRLGTRVKQADGTTVFAHMNDATAFAIGRTLVALIENYQQADGSVRIPDVLIPYVGTDRIA